MTASTMTREQAQSLRTAHGTEAKLLSRKPKYELVAIERSEMAAVGSTRIYGGPFSKDELISSILELRGFGIKRLNEATHVLHHEPGTVGSTACGLCVCQYTETGPDGFLHQCAQVADGHPGPHVMA